MKLAEVTYEWSITVFEVYSFWYLYKSPDLMDETTLETMKKPGNTLTMEVKDFLIKNGSHTVNYSREQNKCKMGIKLECSH